MEVELRTVLCQSILKEMRANDKIVSIGADLDKADGLIPLRKEFPVFTGPKRPKATGVACP